MTAAQGKRGEMASSLDFLEFVKRQNCCRHRDRPATAHHMEPVGMGGSRNKEIIEHLSAVNVCDECHMEIEHPDTSSFRNKQEHFWRNERVKAFEDKYGINLWRENARLLARWIWES